MISIMNSSYFIPFPIINQYAPHEMDGVILTILEAHHPIALRYCISLCNKKWRFVDTCCNWFDLLVMV